VALIIRRHGIEHIRPLQGGLEAWRQRGYPLETKQSPELAAKEV